MSRIFSGPVALAVGFAALAVVGCGPSSCTSDPPAPTASPAPQAPAPEPGVTEAEKQAVAVAVRRVEEARTPVERREAIQDIDEVAALGNDDAIRVLEDALAADDRSVAEAAIDTLEMMTADVAAEPLGRVLEQSDDVDLKIRSLDALSSMSGEPAARAAALGLEDEDPQVREAAVDALLVIDDASSVHSLWQAHRGESDAWVRDLILDALESLGEDTESYRDDG